MTEQFELVRAAIKRIENAADAYLADEASAEKLDAAEEAQRDFGCNNWEDVRDLLSRLEKSERIAHSMAVALGLEVWDDTPRGDTDAILEAVERAMNSRTLEAFRRGLEAARASLGADPVDLPVDLEGLYEEWRKSLPSNAGGVLVAGASLFRDFLKERKFQTGAPR